MSDINIIREKKTGFFSSSTKTVIEIKNCDTNTDDGKARLIHIIQIIIRDIYDSRSAV